MTTGNFWKRPSYHPLTPQSLSRCARILLWFLTRVCLITVHPVSQHMHPTRTREPV